MRVDGIIFADGRIWQGFTEDGSLEQVANVATLPGIVGAALAMPDIHQGYGFPIGGVAAFDLDEGIVSPGGVGYDINCGVRLLASALTREEVEPRLEELVTALFAAVPSGVGSHRKELLLEPEEMEVLSHLGAEWAVRKGFGERDELGRIEDRGRFDDADFSQVSSHAVARGRDQMGTLGSGNHFIEVGYVEEVMAPKAAARMGLAEGMVTTMVHTGSRGFGHQVCTDWLQRLQSGGREHGIRLPDRQLACAPLRSAEGRGYLGAMACAANFAFANRQVISHLVREEMARFFGEQKGRLELVYDVAHNIARIEEHEVDGRRRRLCVHRKGATRALPPGHPLVPDHYRAIGQPVLVPGDMGRCSYVLVGGPESLRQSFGSCAHGAGRTLGRKQALKAARHRRIDQELAHRGIIVKAADRATLAEEMPDAYKDVSQVVEVVSRAGLASVVARLRPLGVVKG